jgi:serine/threonine protein kinase
LLVKPHTNVLPLLGVCCDPNNKLLLVMRVCEKGNLEAMLQQARRTGGLPLVDVLGIMQQVLAAVSHLHKLGIIHRDIRSANILVDALDPLRVVVSDFGLSHLFSDFRRLPSDRVVSTSKVKSLVQGWAAYGPLQWSAPEVCVGDITEGTVPVTTATDVYMLGGLLFELLSAGGRPFQWLEGIPDLLAQRRKQALPVVMPGATSPEGVVGLHGKNTVEAAAIDGVVVNWCVKLGATPGSARRFQDLQDLMLEALSSDPATRPSVALFGTRVRQLYLEESALRPILSSGDSFNWSFNSSQVEAALLSLGHASQADHVREVIQRDFQGTVSSKTLTQALTRAKLTLQTMVRLRSVLVQVSVGFVASLSTIFILVKLFVSRGPVVWAFCLPGSRLFLSSLANVAPREFSHLRVQYSNGCAKSCFVCRGMESRFQHTQSVRWTCWMQLSN